MSGIRFMFRGQSDAIWPIKTTLFRILGNTYDKDEIWAHYIECYQKFKNYVVSAGVLEYKPINENEDLYILSMARHLGFPCHLLDWSASLRKAVLFACSESTDIDGALCIMSTTKPLNIYPIEISPFEIDSPLLISKEFDLIPSNKCISDFPLGRLRRFRQNGFMSIIPRKFLSKDFETILDTNYSLSKIHIAARAKANILKYLQKNGESLDFILAYNDLKNNRLQQLVWDLTNELNNKK